MSRIARLVRWWRRNVSRHWRNDVDRWGLTEDDRKAIIKRATDAAFNR